MKLSKPLEWLLQNQGIHRKEKMATVVASHVPEDGSRWIMVDNLKVRIIQRRPRKREG